MNAPMKGSYTRYDATAMGGMQVSNILGMNGNAAVTLSQANGQMTANIKLSKDRAGWNPMVDAFVLPTVDTFNSPGANEVELQIPLQQTSPGVWSGNDSRVGTYIESGVMHHFAKTVYANLSVTADAKGVSFSVGWDNRAQNPPTSDPNHINWSSGAGSSGRVDW